LKVRAIEFLGSVHLESLGFQYRKGDKYLSPTIHKSVVVHPSEALLDLHERKENRSQFLGIRGDVKRSIFSFSHRGFGYNSNDQVRGCDFYS